MSVENASFLDQLSMGVENQASRKALFHGQSQLLWTHPVKLDLQCISCVESFVHALNPSDVL